MRITNLMLTGVSVLILGIPSIAIADDAPDRGVPAAWTKPGTEWLVRVREYSRSWGLGYSDPRMAEEAQKPRVENEFHMRITVLKPWGEGDERVARIRFSPLDDAPEYRRRKSHVLELDANTGHPKVIKEIKDKRESKGGLGASRIGTERFLFTEMDGFPTDWIVSAADLARIPTRTEDRSTMIETRTSPGPEGLTGRFARFVKKLRPTVTADGKTRVLEVEVARFRAWDGSLSHRIVQTWVPGEGWWRSFTRYIQGHIDLEATLVDRKGE